MGGNYKTFSTINNVDEEKEQKLADSVPCIRNLQERHNFIKSNRIVVVDNYTDWCGPCKTCAPRYAELAQNFSTTGICSFAKENVGDNISHHPKPVRGVPCFHIYVDGKFRDDLTVTGADINAVGNNINIAIQSLNTQ